MRKELINIKNDLDKVIEANSFFSDNNKILLSRKDIKDLTYALRSILIPGLFKSDYNFEDTHYLTYKLFKLAYEYQESDVDVMKITDEFFAKLPMIARTLALDVDSFYNGDPAAKSKEEIIICYPGFYAIMIYRLAQEMYVLDVPYLPRMMSEMAHSSTGIDINPGAKIGHSFFIDHGTGIVIGETCEIGNNVKIYQGVTLGALSTKDGQALSGIKRHPTVMDNVTIYSNASILGGNVVIGENSTIGGNAFVTQSIPANTIVKTRICGLEKREN